MTRLTKALREKIEAAALIKSGIVERRHRLQEDNLNWAEDVRVFGLGGKKVAQRVDEIEAQMIELAKGIPSQAEAFYHLGRRHYTRFVYGGSATWANYKEAAVGVHTVSVDGTHPLAERLMKLEADSEKLQEEQSSLVRNLRATLGRFTTVKALIAGWPEAAELLPEDYGKSECTAIAVPVAQLNAVIGLPSE